MVAMQRRKRLILAGLGAALLGVGLLAAWALWWPPGSAVEVPAPGPKSSPLDCRVVLNTPAERAADLEQQLWLVDHFASPYLLKFATRRLSRNPIVASYVYARVEVENTSETDFAIYPTNGHLFWVSTEVQDPAGNKLKFGSNGDGLRRLLTPIPGTDTAKIGIGTELTMLRPGEVAAEPLSLLGRTSLPDREILPGLYTLRAICRYFRGPDGLDCRVESAPFTMTVTEDHIREWHRLVDKRVP